jgi:inner membrane protein
MKAPTHLTFAGLVGVTASGLGSNLDVASMTALATGALLPDIDTTTSGIGRWLTPLSHPIERRLGHRTLTHSLLGLITFATLTSWLLLLNPQAWLWLLIGIFTHVILDAHNIQGVPLLYPLRLEFVSVTNKSWRCGYGTPAEFGYLAFFYLTALALSPLALDGFSPWFHRAVGAPYGAVEDYLLWRNDYEVFLDVQGVNLLTDQDINARFRIIDVLSSDTLLVEDDSGNTYSVGQRNTDINARRVAAWRGQPHTLTTYRLELGGRRIADLIASLPNQAHRVLLNAELDLNQTLDLPPTLGGFSRLTQQGTTLQTRSATAGDLAPYSNHLITAGSAIVRAYTSGDETLPDTTHLTTPTMQSHVLRIPNLPSLAGLLIDHGDNIIEGERIARYVDDDALELSQQTLDQATTRLPELEAELARQQERHEAIIDARSNALQTAQDDLAKTRYLVTAGAAPRNDLTRQEQATNDAEHALLLAQTDWTSQRNRLNNHIRDTRLAIAHAEREQRQTLAEQWVTAPMSGTVSEIRIARVTTQGIDLEVVLLQGGETQVANNP